MSNDGNKVPGGSESNMRFFSKVAGISFSVVIMMGACTVFGVFVDKRFDTKPIFSIILLLLGLAMGAWYAYRMLMEMLK